MLYRRGAVWWTKFKHNGETVRFSTACSDPKRAATEARRLRVDHEQANPYHSAGVVLEDLEQIHIRALKDKGRSALRIKDIENLWRNLRAHLGGNGRDAMTLTAADIQSYEGLRRGQKIRGQTIRREIQALRKSLKLASRDGLIRRMPLDFDELDNIESDAPLARQASKPRSEAEIRKVLGKLSVKAKTAGYDKMLRFLRLTGLRLEEFRRFEPSWIRSAAVLAVPTIATKTGRVTQVGRTLPLTKEAHAIAKRWGAQFRRKKFNHALWLASSAAKVSPPLTPRDLRATYLTEMARHDPVVAQRLGGHKSLATTSRYVKLAEKEALTAGAAILRGHSQGAHKKEKGQKA